MIGILGLLGMLLGFVLIAGGAWLEHRKQDRTIDERAGRKNDLA